MTRNRWAALSIICFVLWVALILVAHLTIWGLPLAAGFFGGRAVCAAEISALNKKLWIARMRQDDLAEVLSSAADRLWAHNSGETPVIDKQDRNVVE